MSLRQGVRMSVINIERHHSLSFEELTSRVNEIVKKLETKLDIRSEWEDKNTLSFRRKGANGSIELSEHSISITVRLGIMFRALKSVVESELEKVVEAQIAN